MFQYALFLLSLCLLPNAIIYLYYFIYKYRQTVHKSCNKLIELLPKIRMK